MKRFQLNNTIKEEVMVEELNSNIEEINVLEQEGLDGVEEIEVSDVVVEELNENEIIDKRSEYIRHFINANGTFQAILANEPQFTFNETTKQYEDIDNTLEEQDNHITNKKGNFKVRFAKNLENKEIFRMNKGEHEIALKFLDNNHAKAKRHLKGRKDKKRSELSYKSFKDNVDLHYAVTPNGVKENIIIHKPQEEYSFSFKLEAKGMELELDNESKCINIVKHDEVIFKIPAPLMYDSNNKTSYDVSYEVEGDEGDYIFKVIASKEWINHPDRLFPVTIDPEIITDDTSILNFKNYGNASSSVIYIGAMQKDVDPKLENPNGESGGTYIEEYILTVEINMNSILDFINKNEIKIISSRVIVGTGATSLINNTQGIKVLSNGKKIDYFKNIINQKIIIDTTKTITEAIENNLSKAIFAIQLENLSELSLIKIINNNSYLVMNYIGNNIMEHRESLFSQGVNRAGTLFLNLYNGKMIYEHQDIISSIPDFPLQISHIYCGDQKIDAIDNFYHQHYLGMYFKLNIQQYLIKNKKNNSLKAKGRVNTYYDGYGDKYDFIEKYYYIENGIKKFIDYNDIFEDEEQEGNYHYIDINNKQHDVLHAAFNDNGLILMIDYHQDFEEEMESKFNTKPQINYYYYFLGKRQPIIIENGYIKMNICYYFKLGTEEYPIDESKISIINGKKYIYIYTNQLLTIEVYEKKNVIQKVIQAGGNLYFRIPFKYSFTSTYIGEINDPEKTEYIDKEIHREVNYISSLLPEAYRNDELISLENQYLTIMETINETKDAIATYNQSLVDLSDEAALKILEDNYIKSANKYNDLKTTYEKDMLAASIKHTNDKKQEITVSGLYKKLNDKLFYQVNKIRYSIFKATNKPMAELYNPDSLNMIPVPADEVYESTINYLNVKYQSNLINMEKALKNNEEEYKNFKDNIYSKTFDIREEQLKSAIKKAEEKLEYYQISQNNIKKSIIELIDKYKKEPLDYIVNLDNSMLCFDYYGKLVAIIFPNNSFVKINYEEEKIVSLESDKGKKIVLEYKNNLLKNITDPLSRMVRFEYKDNQLTEIIYPDNEKTYFEYNNKYRLQTIADQSGLYTKIIRDNNNDLITIGSYSLMLTNEKFIELSAGARNIDKSYLITYQQNTTSVHDMDNSEYIIYLFDNNGKPSTIYHDQQYGSQDCLKVSKIISNDYSSWKKTLNVVIDERKKYASCGFENNIVMTTTEGVSYETSKFVEGQKSLKIIGNGINERNAKITLYLNKELPLNNYLIISVWAKADSGAVENDRSIYLDNQEANNELNFYQKNRKFGYQVVVKYKNDSSTDTFETSFDCYKKGWQIAAIPIKFRQSTKLSDLEFIYITLMYDYNFNECYFDNININEGIYQLNTYYEDKLLRSNDNGEYLTYYYDYNSFNEPTKIIKEDIMGCQYNSYNSYNSQGKLLRKEDYTGIITENLYDSDGAFVRTKIYHKDEPASAYFDENTYNQDGQLLESYDARGEMDGIILKTKYDYFPNTNLISSIIGKNEEKLCYGYDYRNDNLLNIVSSVNGETNSASFSYNKGYLTKLTQNETDYEYIYDGFGRVIEILVAGKSYLKNNYKLIDEFKSIETKYMNNHNESIITEFYPGSILAYDIYKLNDNNKILVGYDYYTDEYRFQKTIAANVRIDYNDDKYEYKVNNNIILKTTYYNQPQTSTVSTNVFINDSIFVHNKYLSYNNILEKKIINIGYTNLYNNSSINYDQVIKYDKLGRLKKVNFLDSTNYKNIKSLSEVTYGYLQYDDHATNMINSIKYKNKNNSQLVKYKYDLSGNIVEIKENDEVLTKYKYDALNRLIREDNKLLNLTAIYEYDLSGNILFKKTCEYKKNNKIQKKYTYQYDYSWTDQLSSINYEACMYDVIGNPYLYRGISFNWSNGRQLDSIVPNEIDKVEFKYLVNGTRYKKKCRNYEVDYIYEGNTLMVEKRNNNILFFSYGINGIIGFSYNGVEYYYQKNLQGNITYVYNINGDLVAKYLYDAWGNHEVRGVDGTKIYDNESGVKTGYENHVGNINPFRYRGYYYDIETGLYFCNARYYDPEIGRWINADDISYLDPKTINGLNLYSYCGNNPIMRVDPSGHAWYHWVIGGLIIAGVAAALVFSAGTGLLALNALAVAANGATVASVATTILAYATIGSVVGGIVGASIGYGINGWEGASRGFMWGTGIGAILGAVAGGVSYLRDSTVLYRAVGSGEASSIKSSGEFSLQPGGFESKQFGTSLSEVRTYGNIYPNDYSEIVKIRIHNSVLSLFHYNPSCDISILNEVYTVGYDQMSLLNNSYFWMKIFGL